MSASSEFKPAKCISSIDVSPIKKITTLAQQLAREGRDVVILGAGEPDFDTPDHIKEAAAKAMWAGDTKYTAIDGTPEMKAAIRHKFSTENGLDYSHDEISVSAGAKQVLFNAFVATINPGDEVIVPVPYWVSYVDMVVFAGGKPVPVPVSPDGLRLQADVLERAITPRTRWLLLNSPSNPSGAAYSAAQYEPLMEVVRRHPHVWLMVDDMYEHIIYDGFKFATPAAVAPDLKSRTLTINGVSKAYAMTGWRLGYGAGPKELIKGMAVVQGQVTACPTTISMAAAIAALTGPQDIVRERCKSFEKRRDFVVDGLNRIKGLTCTKPEGAFYAFPNCAGVIGKRTPDGKTIDSDAAFADFLLKTVDVALVPGSVFGMAPYLRISYATSTSDLQKACERMAKACAMLS